MIQAIPTYAMGCFKLILGLVHEIEAMIIIIKKKSFGGGKDEIEEKNIGHSGRRWQKPKPMGGMGLEI